jgi:hypothetical protein
MKIEAPGREAGASQEHRKTLYMTRHAQDNLQRFSHIPRELQKLRQWVCWRYEAQEGRKKPAKRSYDPVTGNVPTVNNPDTWRTFAEACRYDKIGLMFLEDSGYVGIDLDTCRDAQTGNTEPWAEAILNIFPGAYREVSPSETGFRIIARGGSLVMRAEGQIEMYDHSRFLTMTGHVLGTPVTTIADCQDDIDLLYAETFGAEDAALDAVVEITVPPRSDEEIMRLVRQQKTAVELVRLYDQGIDPEEDASAMDFKMLMALTFYTRNIAQITRLMEASQLKRPRWDKRHSHGDNYLTYNIKRALKAQTKCYQGKQPQKTEEKLFALKDTLYLFRTPDGIPFVRIPEGIIYPVHGGLRGYLWKQFEDQYSKAPDKEARAKLLESCEHTAVLGENVHPVFTRVGHQEGKVYVDLGRPDWHVVEMTQQGWSILPEAPVYFRRPSTLQPLPLPVKGENLQALLQPCLQLDHETVEKIGAFMVGAYLPVGSLVHLMISALAGSGKTVLARILQKSIDPHSVPPRGLPKNPEDLFIAALNCFVLPIDNVSALSNDFSDALCRLSTGDGFGKRKFYTEFGEIALAVKRPVMLTGITDVVRREDLAGRCLFVHLQPRKDYISERKLEARFHECHPAILGALFDHVAQALAAPYDDAPCNTRLVDWYYWVKASHVAPNIERWYADNQVEGM